MLLKAINIVRQAPNSDDFFDTARLDEPNWDALRLAARNVWQVLDKNHRLPFDDWRDFIG